MQGLERLSANTGSPAAAGEGLSRFVPSLLRARCALEAGRAPDFAEWPLRGALLFVDVVGFTTQVERLAALGPQGVELANELLNDTLGQLVAELTRGGGDVTVFAGDALFVLWPAQDSEADLAPAIRRAARCALQALEHLAQGLAERRAELRFSLGAGDFMAHRLGGQDGRWHLLVSGDALDQVGQADALAQNNALVATREVMQIVGDALVGEALGEGRLRVRAVLGAIPPLPGLEVSEGDPRTLLPYAPEALLHAPGRTLAEFRTPSAVFARLPGLLRDGRLDGVHAHRAAQIVQRVVSALDGSILQFVIDDKGPVFTLAFGLAARVHEDDPARAALCALRLIAELSAEQIACGVGVATGRVFCGLIGAPLRCSYTLIGQTMNLAARLMQRASPGPLLDERTRDLSQRRVAFLHEGQLRVKGMEHPVAHYRALHALDAPDLPDAAPAAQLVGRVREQAQLFSSLDALRRRRQGGATVILGEAGIGKTHLLRALATRAARLGVATLTAMSGVQAGEALARWRRPLRQALSLRAADYAGAPDARASDPFLLAFLGDAPQPLPEADDEERAHRTREALANVLLDTARHEPLLLCVEDAHAMDSLSWALVARLAQGAAEPGAGLMILLTARELEGAVPAEQLARLARSGLLRLWLGPLEFDERAAVAGQAIDAQRLAPAAAQWLAAHSGGNPLFCRELAAAALEHGELRVVDGEARLRVSQAGTSTRLPDTLLGLIASRLDRLHADAQRVLRTAAVIGPRFSRGALDVLHGGDPAAEAGVDEALVHLRERGFIDVETGEAPGHYAFRHALVCESAYDSLPYRRRRELHARLAGWLESRSAAAASLAHHWERAEDWTRAFDARLAAGDAALAAYANSEALDHFLGAQNLRGRITQLQGHARVWSAELGLARVEHRMGNERASRGYIEQALYAAGEEIPQRTAARVTALLRELALRALPAALRPSPKRPRGSALRATVQAFDLLPEILYYDNDPLALSYATLRFLRLAECERAPSGEHARALAWYALLRAGVTGHASVQPTWDRALALASEANDGAVDAWIRLARGSALAQFGQWAQAERWLLDARDRCLAQGDRTRWWNVISGLGHVLSYRGELAAGAAVLEDALRVNRETDNPLFLCWGLAGHADILHRLGREEDRGEVLLRLRRAREALAQRPEASADLFSRGLLCAALWREGLHDEALALTRETVQHSLERAPVVWLQVSAYLGLFEVLWQAAQDPEREREALELLLRLEPSLRAFARFVPVGRPTHRLVCGQIEHLRGRRTGARRHWLAGLVSARALGQPMEAGALHVLLSDSAVDEGDRRTQLGHADAIFRRLDARHALQLTRKRVQALR